MDDLLVARFMALFEGYQLYHGTYVIKGAEDSGKIKGKAQTVRGAATPALYRDHLEGKGAGLGIVLLRADDTVRFGAIDYDSPTMNHAQAEAAVTKLKLPLVLCRSKSGGGHFYCFTSEPVPAPLMRERLEEWKALLGMAARTEVFPKQSHRVTPEDIGSWINLPYFHAAQTLRYAVRNGQAIELTEFLDYAEANQQSEAQLHESAEGPTLFADGPPCLQHLERLGAFPEGTGNLGTTAIMVYLRRRYGDNWKQYVDEYNAALGKRGSEELQQIVRSNSKKEYSYQCKQPPINEYCQRAKCRRQLYGVSSDGTKGNQVELSCITRYDSGSGDDPMWGLEVNGKRVMVTNDQLYAKELFNKACLGQVNEIPVHSSPGLWLIELRKLIAKADIVQLPEDASVTGQLWEWVESFCLDQVSASTIEGVLNGMTFHEEGWVYFRAHDMFKYLDSRRVEYKSKPWVYMRLRERGCEKEGKHVREKYINLWKLPAPKMPGTATKPDAPPTVKEHF
ncbi:MAG TPA: hypothetical protein VGP44_04540 [Gemmatimonadales bacterium]|nr:hypothetical protein [Gemmatimonadales bacterium]